MKTKSVSDWFKMNDKIVNPDKLQAMIISCDKKKENMIYKLNFEKHVLTVISFYIFLRQCSLLSIYICIL